MKVETRTKRGAPTLAPQQKIDRIRVIRMKPLNGRKDLEGDCLVRPGGGYPKIYIKGYGQVLVSHVLHIFENGLPLDTLRDHWIQINHKCGNSACINVRHHYRGTPIQNVGDKVRDHTQWTCMNWKQMWIILTQYLIHGKSVWNISQMRQISYIINGNSRIGKKIHPSLATVYNYINGGVKAHEAKRREWFALHPKYEEYL